MRAAKLVVIFAALALGGCSGGEKTASTETGSLAVSDAWIRLSPVPNSPSAAYFTLHGGKLAEQLTQTQLQAMEVFQARNQEHLDHALTSAETRLQTSLSRIDAVVAETPASFRIELDAVRNNVTVGFMLLKWSCGGLFVAVCLLAVCVVALFVAR